MLYKKITLFLLLMICPSSTVFSVNLTDRAECGFAATAAFLGLTFSGLMFAELFKNDNNVNDDNHDQLSKNGTKACYGVVTIGVLGVASSIYGIAKAYNE